VTTVPQAICCARSYRDFDPGSLFSQWAAPLSKIAMNDVRIRASGGRSVRDLCIFA
jgi:hypothetical protein